MSTIESYQTTSNFYSNAIQQKQQRDIGSVRSKKADDTNKTDKAQEPQLSRKAQDMLAKLKKMYGNMDFMVADFDNEADARALLSNSDKEFSVLFSAEDLEKMASDEKYEKEYMQRLEGAVRMSKEIEEEFGASGENGEITKMGVSFNKDGTMTYFAELEKASDKQQERIEKSKEKHAEEKKGHSPKASIKRTTVQASSKYELLDKMDNIDWGKIKEDVPSGNRFDYSI